MIKTIWHVWHKGHSVQVKRISPPLRAISRGWLFKCECGEVWTR